MKAGRSTKYKPEYCEIAETILSDDKPMCQVAHVLRVHRETLYEWQKRYPGFSDACKRGGACCRQGTVSVADAVRRRHENITG